MPEGRGGGGSLKRSEKRTIKRIDSIPPNIIRSDGRGRKHDSISNELGSHSILGGKKTDIRIPTYGKGLQKGKLLSSQTQSGVLGRLKTGGDGAVW